MKDRQKLRQVIEQDCQHQTDIRFGAARGWVDAIIAPHTIRQVLIKFLSWVKHKAPEGGFRAGLLQV